MRWFVAVFIVIFLALFVVQCALPFATSYSRPMKEADIPGTYKQEFPWGVETLTLKSDRTFREEFQYGPGYASGRSFTHSGTWNILTASNGEVMVRVDSAVIFVDPRGPEYTLPLEYALKAHESSSWGKVLEATQDPDGIVRLMRTP